MPEDYQAVLNDLGVDTSAEQAPVQDEAVSTQTDDNVSAETVEPSKDEEVVKEEAPVVDPDAQRRNEAFASMRSENSSYKKFIQQLMKGAGYQGDEKAFMEQLTNAAYENQAKQQGNQVSPELLKRMDDLENQNRTLIESQNREMFASNLKNLQSTFNLKDEDIKEFIQLAVKEKIDLTIPGTNFVTLYQGLFFDKLKDKMIEDERQKWIAQNSKADKATSPDGKSGKKDPSPTNVNTMAEFDSLLKSFPTN